jgi:hypothetical protein
MKNYFIIRNAVDTNLTNFLYKYFKNKKKVADYLFTNNFIAPECEWYGTYLEPEFPTTYASYSDIAMETLFEEIQKTIEKNIDEKLVPTYSYARLYKTGDVLKKHVDRSACEISATLNLGGDTWSIYVEPNIEIKLQASDMLVYKGCELAHWRDTFDGVLCGQVFFHFNSLNNPEVNINRFDGRAFLGLPKFSTL